MATVPSLPRVDRLAGRAGRTLFNALTPRTDEPVGGPGPQSVGSYAKSQVSAFDPRSPEGLLGWAGLLAGGKGPFGFPERSAPTGIPGFTYQRVARDGTYKTHIGTEDVNNGPTRAALSREYNMRPSIRASEPTALIYNIVNDANGKIAGSISMGVSRDGVHVHDIWVDPIYEKTPVAMALMKIPYKAATSDTMKPISALIAEPTGKLGRILSRLHNTGKIQLSENSGGNGITWTQHGLEQALRLPRTKTRDARAAIESGPFGSNYNSIADIPTTTYQPHPLQNALSNTLDTGFRTAMQVSHRATPDQHQQLRGLINWLQSRP